MANAETPEASQYYIPHHSPWPIVGSVALFTTMLGRILLLVGGALMAAGIFVMTRIVRIDV